MRAIFPLFAAVLIGGLIYYISVNKDTKNGDLAVPGDAHEVLGRSVEGREIQAYKFGDGEKKVVLVGAIHGGYEWNSAILAYEFIDYFSAHREAIPADVSVIVIPVANPDGLYSVVGTSERFNTESAPQFDYSNEIDPRGSVATGRLNANKVDLNRNFGCDWEKEAVWGTVPVSAGDGPFSEPESQVLRDFFLREKPSVAVFFHSADGFVFPNFCGDNVPQNSETLTKRYSEASGYPFQFEYTSYKVTGAAESWLATEGIPAMTVELSTHRAIEFDKNLAGVKAILSSFSD